MNKTDTDYLEKCKKQIEAKLNWVDTSALKQNDFQYISELIFEKTKTQLSLSTIKRIWDDSYGRSFQKNTLDALARFLDYQSWNQFKEQNNEAEKLDLHQPNTEKDEFSSKKQTNKPKWSTQKLLTVIIAVALILLLVFVLKEKTIQKSLVTEDDIMFTSKKSVKIGVPNTVIFEYNASKYPSDDIYIQLSWNPKEREKVSRNDRFYTSTYYYPGFHHAKLIVDDNIVKEHDIHITTNDWLTLVRMQPDDVIPTFIRNKDVISDGNMYASPYLLKLNNIDLTANEFYLSYFNIREFDDLEADDFSFTTELKNSTEELALICQNCRIFVYAENGAIVIPISTKGCVSDIGIVAGEIYKSGKTNDLSGLGCDLTDWRKLKCVVKNKIITIFIDDNEVYQIAYQKPFGKIKGFHYFFKGCGAVNYLNIANANDSIVYEEDFE